MQDLWGKEGAAQILLYMHNRCLRPAMLAVGSPQETIAVRCKQRMDFSPARHQRAMDSWKAHCAGRSMRKAKLAGSPECASLLPCWLLISGSALSKK